MSPTAADGMGHLPVLRERVVALLEPAATRHPVVVDATVGLGGHAAALLERLGPDWRGLLIGLDRDPEALRRSADRLAGYSAKIELVHAVYDELPDVLQRLGVERVGGVLFDLGVSSLQLDEPQRGFSYAYDAPLDMRMDPTAGRSAADVVNTYTAKELARVLRVYGEERFAARIAAAIVRSRPVTSSATLADLVRSAIPAATRRHGGHPAKRTFQALRIEVNAEIEVLERALPAALAVLAVGGRLVALAYHSLEDRAVKRSLTAGLRGCVCPPDLPVCGCGREPELRLLTRGAERPAESEVAENPRAASARLRAAERVRDAA
jgi:16S rRNA (cytosine1402-N4)-methyltransferase